MINAYRSALVDNYVNFSGRLSVPGYWWFFLANFLIVLVLQVLAAAATALIFVALVYALVTLLPSLAAGVRRLHDTGRSGWFILIGLIPFIGFIILIVFLAGAGQSGSNQYGPPPAA